jgi:hypothetical protein
LIATAAETEAIAASVPDTVRPRLRRPRRALLGPLRPRCACRPHARDHSCPHRARYA